MKKLGRIKHHINVSEEYLFLAEKDEETARLLKENKKYRHSIYFFIQAMEKYIKSKIFARVDPNREYYRKMNQHHSLENAINFLIEIWSNDNNIKEQIKNKLNQYVFEGINFQYLHNNLRYPSYNEKNKDYSIIEYDNSDCIFMEDKNEKLKKWLSDINRL